MKSAKAKKTPTKAARASVGKTNPLLERVIRKEERIESRKDTEEFVRYVTKKMIVNEDGSSADLLVPPMELQIDPFENASRPFDPKAAYALALNFIQSYLAATGNITGVPDKDTGVYLEFAQVFTLLVNTCFQVARGDIPTVRKFPLSIAWFLWGLSRKVGLTFRDKRLSFLFVEIPPDHTELVTGTLLRNYIENASLLDGEGALVDSLTTGGFRPMVVSTAAYDADKAAVIFSEMLSYLSEKQVTFDTPHALAGMRSDASGDAYSLNIPAVILGAYSGVLDTVSAQYRDPPKLPLLAQAQFVQPTETIEDQEDSRDFAATQMVGGPLSAHWHAFLLSTVHGSKSSPGAAKEVLRPVPIMFNDVLKYMCAITAQAAKQTAKFDVVIMPNALEFAVAVYNAIQSFFWQTTRAYAGVALPRAVTAVPYQHPVFLQADASNCPSQLSRKTLMYYEVIEAFRSFNCLVTEESPDGRHTYRRVPAVWCTHDFEPARFVESEFERLGLVIPPVPTDASAGTLWGRWFCDLNRWTGGLSEPTKINLTDSPYVAIAVSKFNKMLGVLKSSCPITVSMPASHNTTFNKWVRILKTDKLSKTTTPAYDADNLYGDGPIYTSGHPVTALGSFKDGPEDSLTTMIESYLIPMMPDGVYKGLKIAEYNMLLGLPVCLNKSFGGTLIELRTEGLADQICGNAVVAAWESSELDASYFAGKILHAVGGGLYKGRKEADDWTFLDKLDGKAADFVKQLVSACEAAGVRRRVIEKLKKVCTEKDAVRILQKHMKHRKRVKWISNFFYDFAVGSIKGLIEFLQSAI